MALILQPAAAATVLTVKAGKARAKARVSGRGGGRSQSSAGSTVRKLGQNGGSETESESSGQDNESESSDPDWDQPLVRRRGAAAVVANPAVGAKVDIKWDQTQWATDREGWCTGVVTAISDGTLPAPVNQSGRRQRKVSGKRSRVNAGYSIVKYDGYGEFVHLLDQAHHVSNWGDREYAWRLLSCPDIAEVAVSGVRGEVVQLGGLGPNKVRVQAWAEGDSRSKDGSGAGECGGGLGGGSPTRERRAQRAGPRGQGPAHDADSDDVPLFTFQTRAELLGPKQGCSSSLAGGDKTGAAARAASAAAAGLVACGAHTAPEFQPLVSASRSRGAGEVDRERDSARAAAAIPAASNVWSLSYCVAVFGKLQPENFCLGTAKFNAGMYTVTRRMPTTGKFPVEANIKIPVRTESSRMYYMAYSEETGFMLFAVTQIRKPVDGDWSNTLRGYQVFTSEEALNRVDRESDCVNKGFATSLGAKSLRHEVTLDQSRGQVTYHPCDWEVSLDVRCIVGVVRQALATQRENQTYERLLHAKTGCPAKASLIYTGQPFSETREGAKTGA